MPGNVPLSPVRPLLDFLVKIRFLLFLVVLEAVSMALIHRHTFLRDNVVFTTAGTVWGHVCELNSSITGYVGLKDENEKLTLQVASLRAQLDELKNMMEISLLPETVDSIVVARVVSNIPNKNQNFITVDKGTDEGVMEGMGVCNADGVVGVVYRTSRSYSLVMPLVNTNVSLSCQVKGRDSYGFLNWNGQDIYVADLVDLPSRSGVMPGDTIITSGYSESFRMGMIVGVVSSADALSDADGMKVKVRLAADFGRLDFVYIDERVPENVIPEEFEMY